MVNNPFEETRGNTPALRTDRPVVNPFEETRPGQIIVQTRPREVVSYRTDLTVNNPFHETHPSAAPPPPPPPPDAAVDPVDDPLNAISTVATEANITNLVTNPPRTSGGDPIPITGIAGLSSRVDAFLSEEHESKLDTTKSPVESGGQSVTHAVREPSKVRLTGRIVGPRSLSAWQEIKAMQSAMRLLTVHTSLGAYQNMMIVGARSFIDDKSGHNLPFELEMEELIVYRGGGGGAAEDATEDRGQVNAPELLASIWDRDLGSPFSNVTFVTLTREQWNAVQSVKLTEADREDARRNGHPRWIQNNGTVTSQEPTEGRVFVHYYPISPNDYAEYRLHGEDAENFEWLLGNDGRWYKVGKEVSGESRDPRDRRGQEGGDPLGLNDGINNAIRATGDAAAAALEFFGFGR